MFIATIAIAGKNGRKATVQFIPECDDGELPDDFEMNLVQRIYASGVTILGTWYGSTKGFQPGDITSVQVEVTESDN